ncbi:transaldolase A, partial [Oleispira antarctica]
ELLAQLEADTSPLEQKLFSAENITDKPKPLTEAEFRWSMNNDPMAHDKLADGIRRFAADQVTLETMLSAKIKEL